MSAVITSAPAKVILFGDHFVVHGATALTTALDLRTFVRVQASTGTTTPSIHIVLPDINVDVTVPLASLQYSGPLCSWDNPDRIANEQLLAFLEGPAAGNRGVVAVLFLVVSIAGPKINEKGSFELHLLSEFQPGVGLGSSGAFNVCLSAALLRFFGHAPSTDDVDLPNADRTARGWTAIKRPTETACQLINRWAYAAETIMHGRPSGIDNSISTFGGAVAFQSGNIKVINQVPPMKLTIVNTKVPRSTKLLVTHVGKVKSTFETAFAPLVQSVEQISQTTLKIFDSYLSTTEEATRTDLEQQFELLLDLHQGLLNGVGVGHESIDQVVKLSKKHGLHAKITGAGGGGCVIVFVPTGTSATTAEAVKQDLTGAGFEAFDAKIGAAGLLYHTSTPDIFSKSQ